MGTMKPQPRILVIWRIHLAVSMAIPAFLNALFFRLSDPLWVWITLGWLLIFLALYLVYLPLRYRGMSFAVAGDKILVYNGVLYARVKSIPMGGIQFTTLWAGPLERMLGLCSLILSSAGGQAALPGLRRKDAEALVELLHNHEQ